MNRSGTPSQNRPTLNSYASTSSAGNGNSNSNNDDAYKAALKGASLAFQNTGSKAQGGAALPQPRSIDNGALIAATSTAHQYGLSPSRSPPRTKSSVVSRHTTGSSVLSTGTSGFDSEHGAIVQKLQQLSPQFSQRHAGTSLLMPPGKHTTPDPKSPSFIAATLAASRSGSPSPRQPVQPHPYQQTARRQQGGVAGAHSAATSVTSLDLTADPVPLPSTNALISMFEKRGDDTDPVKKQYPVPKSSSNKPPISKPKPKPKPRPVTPPGGLNIVPKPIDPPEILPNLPTRERPVSFPVPAREPTREKPETQKESIRPESKKPPPTPPPPRSTKAEFEESPSASAALPKRKPRASTPPRSVSSANTILLSPQPRRASSQKILAHRSSDDDDTLATQPKAPPAVKSKPQRRTPSMQYVEKSSGPLKESPRPIVLSEKERRPSSSSSNDTFVSASSAPPLPAPPRRLGMQPLTPDPPRPARPASTQSTPASARSSQNRLLAPPPLPQRQQQQPTPGIPLDSLTNAIVAGSLASSRLTPSLSSSSASKKPPSPPPSRKQNPLRMRQTLRQPLSAKKKSDDEDGAHNRHRHRKKPFGKSNKHSHHEGNRKRWREEITLREKKRYEGVWASNRGLLLLGNGPGGGGDRENSVNNRYLNPNPNQNLSPSQNRDQNQNQNQKRPSMGGGNEAAAAAERTASSSAAAATADEKLGGDDSNSTNDRVANVVVRDLWARSRLPFDELAEVWDLVDGQGRGALDRAEFVVGMWLVDQRLRGRKIPRKVSESVWSSARGGGVKVRVKGVKAKVK